MAIKKNLTSYSNKSFLKNAEFKNFYLGVNKLPKISLTKSKMVVVPPECENRIDLFSYQQYGSSRLWWIIALANADTIRDPIWDFQSGMTVYVPVDSVLIENALGSK